MSRHFPIDYETGSLSASPPPNLTTLPNTRLLINDPPNEWSDAVKKRLDELARLENGWDGYNALPVSFVNANFSLRLMEAICEIDAPSPQIVPGTGGDLQIEWHTADAVIEVHIQAPYMVHAWRQNDSTGTNGEEVKLERDFTILADWVRTLAERSSATGSAAA